MLCSFSLLCSGLFDMYSRVLQGICSWKLLVVMVVFFMLMVMVCDWLKWLYSVWYFSFQLWLLVEIIVFVCMCDFMLVFESFVMCVIVFCSVIWILVMGGMGIQGGRFWLSIWLLCMQVWVSMQLFSCCECCRLLQWLIIIQQCGCSIVR